MYGLLPHQHGLMPVKHLGLLDQLVRLDQRELLFQMLQLRQIIQMQVILGLTPKMAQYMFIMILSG
jgi:hypothetical protein